MQEAPFDRILEWSSYVDKHTLIEMLLNNFLRVMGIGVFIGSWWWLCIVVENFVNPFIGAHVSIVVASVVGLVGAFIITFYGFFHFLLGIPVIILIVVLIPLRFINQLFIRYKMEGVFCVLVLCCSYVRRRSSLDI